MLKLIFFAVLALVGTTLLENDGVQIFRTPTSYFGWSCPFGDLNICQSAYVGHLSTNFHSVSVFLWVFQGTELIGIKFKPTGSVFNLLLVSWVKKWNPLNVLLFTNCNKDQNLQQTPVRIDQHSADLCEISFAYVYWLLHYLHCKITIIDSSSSDSLSQISSLIIIVFVQSLL